MRILLLTDADVFAGTERHILDLASAISADFNSQTEVKVACPRPSPLAQNCAENGIEVVAIPKRGLVDWNAVRILRRLLKTRKIDIVHAHNGRTALAAALAVMLARRGSFVMTQHFLRPNHTSQSGIKGAISTAAHRFVNRRANAILAISQAVSDAMRERGETDESKIAVILNGVPDARHRVLDSVQSARQKFAARTRPLIVCASRLEAEKGVEILVSAMKIVRENCPSALCLIAGEGVLRDSLESQIERENLHDNLRLVGFQNDVLSLVSAADLFVLPSRNEGFGLVLVEAMALEKPVVAMRAGGPIEIVEENVTGFLVAPDSPQEFANAISQLLRDETLRDKMGKAARVRYENCFAAKRMTHETVAVYRRVLEGKN